MQPCLSGGLWDAGASITVGDHHIANWLIGQVRDSTQTEDAMRAYAPVDRRRRGGDRRGLPRSPVDVARAVRTVAQALHTLASQLSTVGVPERPAGPLHRRADGGRSRARAAAGPARAGPEDGVGRPPGRRRGPRLQQHARARSSATPNMALDQRRPGQPAPRGPARDPEGRPAVGGSDAAAAGLRAQADDCAARARSERDRRRPAEDAAPADRRGHRPACGIPAPALSAIKMDPSQIDQILANLCVNARDAIAGIGHITLETGRRLRRRRVLRGTPGLGARRLRPPHGQRRRLRDEPGGDVAPVRAVLHDQAPRARARASASPRSTASSSRTTGSSTSRVEPDRGHHVQHLPAAVGGPGAPTRRRRAAAAERARRPRDRAAGGRRSRPCCAWPARR